MRSLRELSSLEGRVALITGGAGHIGSAICEALRELGARIAIADQRGGEEVGKSKSNGQHYFSVDLSDEEETRKLVPQVLDWAGRLDVLVHLAAYVGTTRRDGWNAPFDQQTVAAWDEAMRVNLTAAFILAQEARPALKRSGRGSIVLVSSIYGLVGPDMRLYEGTSMNNIAAYAASKGGLIQLTRYLATVFAPEVRVNALTPGGVWRQQPNVFVERYSARTPLARMAAEEDFKGAAAYLASDLSAYVTGQNLIVDGGWTTW